MWGHEGYKRYSDRCFDPQLLEFPSFLLQLTCSHTFAMRFATLLSTIAMAASFVVGQEAARFGFVSVSPCPITGGQVG